MKTYHVISHTHWDREWYRPLAVMRRHLMELMDNLLDILRSQPDYIFHLDAQTICLEDYLEVRPDRRSLLEGLIRERRLLVGPWYVQNDFFLTSGEATIRNLLIGRRMANAFGYCDTIGYAPDQFGLISQLPQILRGFGIDNCIFARGYDTKTQGVGDSPQPNEFLWISPDGSEILGIFLSSWYNNAQRFSGDPAKALKYLQNAGAELADRTQVPHLLMMNGVDHLEPQEDVLKILDGLNSLLPDGESVRQSTLSEYIGEVRKHVAEHSIELRRLVGEMRYGENILQGTLSGWASIKRRNVEAQALLELQLEPESVMLSAFADVNPDLQYQQYFWKKLIENHPHDTICTCSNDRVQEDAINRLDNVITGAIDATNRNRQLLLDHLDRRDFDPSEYLLVAFNPLPFDRSATIPAKLFLPIGESIEKMRVIDCEGDDIRFEVTSTQRRRKATFSPINLPGMIEVTEVDVLLKSTHVPACGYATYRVVPNEGQPIVVAAESPEDADVLENEFLKVRISSNGKVDICDKDTGVDYNDAVGFTDETDNGSAYNFKESTHNEILWLDQISQCASRRIEGGELCQAISVEYTFERAKSYDFALDCVSVDSATNRLTVLYSLVAGSRQLDIDILVENRSAHHRLRMIFQPEIVSDVTVASAPFDLVERDRTTVSSSTIRDQPNCGVISLASQERQVAIFNVGLSEYEHHNDGSISLTLLRSFTTINDIENIGVPSQFSKESVDFSCPKSAMIGDFRLRAALRPGQISRTKVMNEYHAFLSPMNVVFDSSDNHKFCGGRPCVQDSSLQELFFRDLPPERRVLPLVRGMLNVTGNAVVSALKPSEDGLGYILRLSNFEKHAETIQITFSVMPASVKIVSLDEEREISSVEMKGNQLELDVNPGSIKTLKIV